MPQCDRVLVSPRKVTLNPKTLWDILSLPCIRVAFFPLRRSHVYSLFGPPEFCRWYSKMTRAECLRLEYIRFHKIRFSEPFKHGLFYIIYLWFKKLANRWSSKDWKAISRWRNRPWIKDCLSKFLKRSGQIICFSHRYMFLEKHIVVFFKNIFSQCSRPTCHNSTCQLESIGNRANNSQTSNVRHNVINLIFAAGVFRSPATMRKKKIIQRRPVGFVPSAVHSYFHEMLRGTRLLLWAIK